MCVISVSPGATASLFIYTKSTNSNGPQDTPDSGNPCIHQCHSAEFEVCVWGVAALIVSSSGRYKEHEDGFLRLQLIRYESVELTEQLMRERQNRQAEEEEDLAEEQAMEQESPGMAPSEVQVELRGVLLEEQRAEEATISTEEAIMYNL